MRRSYVPLSEDEKITIIHHYKNLGRDWKHIGELVSRPPTTVASFIKSYLKHKTISPKRGKKNELSITIIDSVISVSVGNPEAHLRDIADDTFLSHTKVKQILNKEGIRYYKRVQMPPLTAINIQKRIILANNFANIPYIYFPTFVFSDESTIVVDRDKGGIWRYRGQIPPEGFYEKIAHPIQVMVWGAIGKGGYRTPLIQCNGHVNAEKYIDILERNKIFENLYNNFPNGFIWQQDNAPAHVAAITTYYLQRKIGNWVEWPPHSPDLNPIEQLWGYLKSQIKGMCFNSKEELFNKLSELWDSIPNEIIHNYYSSFKARLQACLQHQGACLNGKWADVHKYHAQYRTNLSIFGEIPA